MAYKNKEDQKAYWQRYYKTHREELIKRRCEYQKEYMSKWRERNKDKWNEYQRQYRLKKKGEKDTSKIK